MVIFGDYSCGFHTGMDFPASGTSESNPDLYSVVEDGEVVYVYKNATGNGGSVDLGNQVQIYDRKNNVYYRYCHMLHGSISVNVGDNVNLSTKLRKNAETQVIQQVHTFIWNVRQHKVGIVIILKILAIICGIPNIRGTVVVYDGSLPDPEPPSPSTSKNSTKWLKSRSFRLNLKFR